jgi:hypothetical protein
MDLTKCSPKVGRLAGGVGRAAERSQAAAAVLSFLVEFGDA